MGLIEVWRANNPKVRDHKHFSNVHKSHSRIDFFCVSKQLSVTENLKLFQIMEQ